MLGTFNQLLPITLSNSYWSQSKPTSLHDVGVGVVPSCGQQSMKYVQFADLDLTLKNIEILSYQNYLLKLPIVPHLAQSRLFYDKNWGLFKVNISQFSIHIILWYMLLLIDVPTHETWYLLATGTNPVDTTSANNIFSAPQHDCLSISILGACTIVKVYIVRKLQAWIQHLLHLLHSVL